MGHYTNEIDREIDKASKTIGQYVSRVRVNRRTALNEDPDLEGHLGRADLAGPGRQYVEMVLGGRAPKEVRLPKRGREDPATTSNIEQHFANELVKKLPKIVDRAASLDEIGDEEIDKGLVCGHVKSYWEEAHRCYLYGFHVACAVLCRAILASALENVCDPKGTIQKCIGPEESYFKALVEKARNDGLLTDDRPEWAIRIRDAGNDAIHNFPRFQQRWCGRLDDILLNTRKVALDLYTPPKSE